MASFKVTDNTIQVPIKTGSGAVAKYLGARAYVEKVGNEARITCVDKDGKTIAVVTDGKNGTDGKDGNAGVGIVDISITDDYRLVIVKDDGTTWTSDRPVRGEQGENGENGDTPVLKTISATIDGNIGTPQVSATITEIQEEDEDGELVGTGEYNIDFDFKNLKGEKGDRGDDGKDGATVKDDDNGNLVIESGGSYDDAEIRAEINSVSDSVTELAERLKESQYTLVFDGDIDTTTSINVLKPFNDIIIEFYCTSSETASSSGRMTFSKNGETVFNGLLANAFTTNRTYVYRFSNQNGYAIASIPCYVTGNLKSTSWWGVAYQAGVSCLALIPNDLWVSDIDSITIAHNNLKAFSGHMRIWIA